jgi:hypothetical protein
LAPRQKLQGSAAGGYPVLPVRLRASHPLGLARRMRTNRPADLQRPNWGEPASRAERDRGFHTNIASLVGGGRDGGFWSRLGQRGAREGRGDGTEGEIGSTTAEIVLPLVDVRWALVGLHPVEAGGGAPVVGVLSRLTEIGPTEAQFCPLETKVRSPLTEDGLFFRPFPPLCGWGVPVIFLEILKFRS